MSFKTTLSKVLRSRHRAFPGTLAAHLDRIERKIDRLEQHSHGGRATYVGNNRVLVKIVVADRNLACLVEANDRLLSPWFIVTGTYETVLTDYLVAHLRPDSHCIDLGSNFGYFTCLMARFAPHGRVIAVEADAHVHDLVRDNLAINGFEGHAEAIHAAVGQGDEPVTLYRRTTRSANTSIIAFGTDFTDHMREPPVTPFTVPGVRVDTLADRMQGRVDFIKMDVEGSEPLAFRGAHRTIADNPRLVTLMEWSPGQIATAGFPIPDFLAELDAMGLEAFDMDSGRLERLSWTELGNLDYRAAVVLKRRP